MKNRSWSQIILMVLVALLMLGAVSFVAYRLGFQQGNLAQASDLPERMPLLSRFGDGDQMPFGDRPFARQGGTWHPVSFRGFGFLLGALVIGALVILTIKVASLGRAQESPAPAPKPSRRQTKKKS